MLRAAGLPARAAEPMLTISPAQVQIGAFFNGQTVTVSGTIPAGTQAVLEVMGTSADEHLMRKGRRGGLWMNVGEIKVQDAPSLYLIMSTDSGLLTAAPPTATWGYRALEKRLAFSRTGRVGGAREENRSRCFPPLGERSGRLFRRSPGRESP